ncbi:MAG: hypothetical protein WB797_10120 [Nocardioides sp.]
MGSWDVRRSRPPRSSRYVGLVLALTGLVLPFSAARAAASIPPGACGSVLVTGASWLLGAGVDVLSNGSDEGTGTSCTTVGTYGPRYQSTELVNRLYRTKAWTTKAWAGTGGRSTPMTLDSMYDKAPASLGKEANGSVSYLSPGDVISVDVYDDGVFVPGGDVLVVNTAGSIVGGTVPVVSQNSGTATAATPRRTAVLSNGTLTMAAAGTRTYQVIGVVHAPGGRGAPPPTDPYFPVTAVTSTSGVVKAKTAGLGSDWVTEVHGARQVVVASDSAHGPTVAVLKNDGTVLAKTGSLNAPWVTEMTDVRQVAVASDPTHGPLLAVLTNDGTLLAKTGDLDASWVTETGGVRQVAVATDAAHGPLLGVVTTSGEVRASTGALGSAWTTETESAGQVAVATDPIDGPLIAVLLNDGTLQAKGGALDANWIAELDRVRQVAVASDPTHGPLIAVLTKDHAVEAKTGALNGQWSVETHDGRQVSVGTDPKKGPTIDILKSDRSVLGKLGDIGGKWQGLASSGGSLSVQLRDPGVLIGKTRPAVKGKLVVGAVVHARHGKWSPGSLTFHYRWTAGGVVLHNRSSRLHVKKRQLHKRISVRVTASRAGYTSASATSHPSARVTKKKKKK